MDRGTHRERGRSQRYGTPSKASRGRVTKEFNDRRTPHHTMGADHGVEPNLVVGPRVRPDFDPMDLRVRGLIAHSAVMAAELPGGAHPSRRRKNAHRRIIRYNECHHRRRLWLPEIRWRAVINRVVVTPVPVLHLSQECQSEAEAANEPPVVRSGT